MNHPNLSQLSRRQLLAGAAAAGLAGVASGGSPAFAKAPMANTQAPSFYRFKLGAFELTAVSDGPLQMGEPQANVFSDTEQGGHGQGPGRQLPADSQCLDGAERAGGEHRQSSWS